METINKLCNNLMLLTPKISRLKPISLIEWSAKIHFSTKENEVAIEDKTELVTDMFFFLGGSSGGVQRHVYYRASFHWLKAYNR